jgi:hypothetical protein
MAGDSVDYVPAGFGLRENATRVAVLNKRSSEIFVERENEFSSSELN